MGRNVIKKEQQGEMVDWRNELIQIINNKKDKQGELVDWRNE